MSLVLLKLNNIYVNPEWISHIEIVSDGMVVYFVGGGDYDNLFIPTEWVNTTKLLTKFIHDRMI